MGNVGHTLDDNTSGSLLQRANANHGSRWLSSLDIYVLGTASFLSIATKAPSVFLLER